MTLKSPKSRLIEGNTVPKVEILGIEVGDINPQEAVERTISLALDRKKSHQVVTVNPEFVMLAQRNPAFRNILNEADLAVADGTGVVWAKLILGGKVHERVTGVDLIRNLCAKSAKKAIRVGFLGGFGDVAEKVAKRQKEANHLLRVVFAGPGDPTTGSDLRLKRALSAAGRIDALFVAYGMGQQEFWIRRFMGRVNVGVFIGVGGAFDYLSKVKMRAPRFMQQFGLEWLWRVFWEPPRIWRMRVLPLFIFLVLVRWILDIFGKFLKKERFGGN